MGDDEDPLKGLTTEEAETRLQQYGRNEIPEKRVPWYALLLRQFVGPFPCMIETACVLAAVAQKFEDFGIILAMLLVNAALGFYQEAKVRQWDASWIKHGLGAPHSPIILVHPIITHNTTQTQYRASLLKHRVVSAYSVKRDGSFRTLEGPLLVPGDMVFLKGGQIVPADCQYLEGSVLMVSGWDGNKFTQPHTHAVIPFHTQTTGKGRHSHPDRRAIPAQGARL